jgi:hypothetical protein
MAGRRLEKGNGPIGPVFVCRRGARDLPRAFGAAAPGIQSRGTVSANDGRFMSLS